MKVSNVALMRSLDPDDILDSSGGESKRTLKRKALIKKFLYWSYNKENHRWNHQMSEESAIVKRQFDYGKMLAFFGLFANFALYNSLMTGIYNFRSTEVLDMRRVPFLAKFGISSFIAYQMCVRLWDTHVYEAELYEIALRYRHNYDPEYQQRV